MKILITFAAAALIALPAAAQETVRLAINLSPISALPLIAQSKGLFQKHGIDVQIINFSSGRQALETVLGGGADIATAAESPVTAATFANQKLALLARMEYSELKTLVTVPNARPADLKGKRIGYTAGTGSEVYTHELLKRIGLTKADVTLVNLRPQDMVAAAASKSIDAYNIWEPHVANGRKTLGDKASSVIALDNVYSETFNVVVTDGYAKKHRDTLVPFLRALLDAERWLKANKEDAVTLVAQLTSMKREDLAGVWDDYVFELALDELTLKALTRHAQWRIDSGNAAGGSTRLPDFNLVVQPALLKEVAAERVRLPGPQ